MRDLVTAGALASPYGVRSLDREHPERSPRNYWRGPVWANVTWLCALALEDHGERVAAAKLRCRMMEAIEGGGMREYFVPDSGRGLGARDFAWTAALCLRELAREGAPHADRAKPSPDSGIPFPSWRRLPDPMTDAERWFREQFARTPRARRAVHHAERRAGRAAVHGGGPAAMTERIGFPGEFPFTRGVYPSMYRGRLWTMRQFAGFGTAQETNERFRYLLDHGQTGLSTAFDMPSLMGHDSDHPRSRGRGGPRGRGGRLARRHGDAVRRASRWARCPTSMTINAPAAVMLAFYVVAAERQGVPAERLAGTIQTDILKEYIAQKEWCFPIEPAMRLVTDMVEFCARRMPRWHPISISGYHIREAGSTAQQELAFTLKDGFTYVEQALERGPRRGRVRAAAAASSSTRTSTSSRRSPSTGRRGGSGRSELRDTYGARDERSLLMRFHTQTAGVSLTAQQPLNNVVRTATEALSAVLGGTQSLHTNSFDEALALPTEEAVRVALRTQQILAHETGVANTIDPLGRLVLRRGADGPDGGGRLRLLRTRSTSWAGWSRRSSRTTRSARSPTPASGCRRRSSGASGSSSASTATSSTTSASSRSCRIPPELERKQIGRVQAVRAGRDGEAAEAALSRAARRRRRTDRNLMEPLLDCARAHCTEGEIVQSLQRVFGTYTETPVF